MRPDFTQWQHEANGHLGTSLADAPRELTGTSRSVQVMAVLLVAQLKVNSEACNLNLKSRRCARHGEKDRDTVTDKTRTEPASGRGGIPRDVTQKQDPGPQVIYERHAGANSSTTGTSVQCPAGTRSNQLN